MGRKYVRKTSRQTWTKSNLEAAIRALRLGLPKNTASRIYGIPKRTLLRYAAKEEQVPTISRLGAFKMVFSSDQEEELVQNIIRMSSCGFGLNHKDIRQLAFQTAEKNEVDHPFDRKRGMAGSDWLRLFLRRHPEISLRKAENTSLARLQGFNRETVNAYYDLLEQALGDEHYSPDQIWNVDETGFSTVQTRPIKVFAKKGQRQVAATSSAERGTNTTVILAMSASGKYIPPTFVFPRSRMSDALKCGAPEDSLFLCNPSGWSTVDTCSLWFDHFLKFARPSGNRPILLILDGHSSHTKNIHMLEKASANNVRILTIPPHTSHKLQPLDVTVMGPVKTAYSDAMLRFTKSNHGKVITIHNVASLVNEALATGATASNALSGFCATGIYPLNRGIFTDADFATADFLEASINKTTGDELLSTPRQGSTNENEEITVDENLIPAMNNDCNVQSEILVELTGSLQQGAPMKLKENFNILHPAQILVDPEESDFVLDVCSIEDYSTQNLNSHATGIYEPYRGMFTDTDFATADFLEVSINKTRGDVVLRTPRQGSTNEDEEISIDESLIPAINNDCSVQPEILIELGSLQQGAPMELKEDFNIQHPPQFLVDPEQSNYDVCTQNLNSRESMIYDINDFDDIVNSTGGVCETHDEMIVLDPNVYYVVGQNGEIIVGSSPTVEIQEHFNLMESSSIVEQLELGRNIPSKLAANTMVPPKADSQVPTQKRKAVKRKGQAEDLTSASYRKQLREASASRLIKSIKKKGRKRIVTEDPTDSLCSSCGVSFSATGNGDGWSNCLLCHRWFHEACNSNSALTCSSCC